MFESKMGLRLLSSRKKGRVLGWMQLLKPLKHFALHGMLVALPVISLIACGTEEPASKHNYGDIRQSTQELTLTQIDQGRRLSQLLFGKNYFRISNPWLPQGGGNGHAGVDYGAARVDPNNPLSEVIEQIVGDNVYSPVQGTIVRKDPSCGAISIDDGRNVLIFLHMNNLIDSALNSRVEIGEVLGTVGAVDDGACVAGGAHLHLEIHRGPYFEGATHPTMNWIELAEPYAANWDNRNTTLNPLTYRYAPPNWWCHYVDILNGEQGGNDQPILDDNCVNTNIADGMYRARFATILSRSLGITDEFSCPEVFGDVEEDTWFGPHVNALAQLDYGDGTPVLTSGPTHPNFNPDNPITRCESLKVVIEGFDLEEPILNDYEDRFNHRRRPSLAPYFNDAANIPNWCVPYVQTGFMDQYELVTRDEDDNGVISARERNFRGNEPATLGEIARWMVIAAYDRDNDRDDDFVLERRDFREEARDECTEHDDEDFFFSNFDNIAEPIVIEPEVGGGAPDNDEPEVWQMEFNPADGLNPGRINHPNEGAVVPNDGFDVEWDNGSDDRGRQIGTALFCRINGGEEYRETPFYNGLNAQGRVGDLAPGSVIECWLRTRLTGDTDVYLESDPVEWRVDGAYAAMNVEGILPEGEWGACSRLRFDARIQNEGGEGGFWNVRAWLHPAGADENHPDAIEANRSHGIFLEPGEEGVVGTFDIEHVWPLTINQGELEISIVALDENRGIGVPGRLRVPVFADDVEAPVLNRFDVFGRGTDGDEVIPGQQHRISFTILDDHWVDRVDLEWSLQGANDWQSIEFETFDNCKDIYAGNVDWLIPDGFGAGTRLDVRVRGWDLAGTMVQGQSSVVIRAVGDPVVFFFHPLGAEVYEEGIQRDRCVQVEAMMLPAPGVRIFDLEMGWSTGEDESFEQDRDLPVPENGMIEYCLPTYYPGDQMRVAIRLEDENGIRHFFHSEPVEVVKRTDCAPWGGFHMDDTQFEWPADGTWGTSNTTYSITGIDENRMTVLRRDYRQRYDSNQNAWNDQLGFSQLFINRADLSFIGGVPLLNRYAEERTEDVPISQIQEPGVYLGLERVDDSCDNANRDICDYDLFSRTVEANRVAPPVLVERFDNVHWARNPSFRWQVKLDDGSVMLFLSRYINPADNSVSDSTQDIYRYTVQGWQRLFANIELVRYPMLSHGDIWGLRRIRHDDNGNGEDEIRYSMVEFNPQNGVERRTVNVLETGDRGDNYLVRQDRQNGDIYLFVYNNEQKHFQMVTYDGNAWQVHPLRSLGDQWRGMEVSAHYPQGFAIGYGQVYFFDQFRLSDNSSHNIIIRLSLDEDVNLDEHVVDCYRVQDDEDLVWVTPEGGLMRVPNEYGLDHNLEDRLMFQQTVGFDNCFDGNACTGDSWSGLAGECSHAVVECAQDGNLCNGLEVCNPVNGECISDAAQVPDCNDGNACNGDEVCNPATGQCEAGEPLVVDDERTCTLDTCDDDSGEVINESIDAICIVDACHAFECNPDDPEADAETGCLRTPLPLQEDGLVCTEGIVCDPGTGETIQGIVEGFCLIDGGCYPDGAAHPEETCQVCDADLSNEGWTEVAAGVGNCSLFVAGNMESPELFDAFGNRPLCTKTEEAALGGELGLQCGPGGAATTLNDIPFAPGAIYDLSLQYENIEGTLSAFVYGMKDGRFTIIPHVGFRDSSANGMWTKHRRVFEVPDGFAEGGRIVILSSGTAHMDDLVIVRLEDGASLVPNGSFEETEPSWSTFFGPQCDITNVPGEVYEGEQSMMCGPGQHSAKISGIILQQDKLYRYRFDYSFARPMLATWLGARDTNGVFHGTPNGNHYFFAASEGWQSVDRLIRGSAIGSFEALFYASNLAFIDDVSVHRLSDNASLIHDGSFELDRAHVWKSYGQPCTRIEEGALEGQFLLQCQGQNTGMQQGYIPVLPGVLYRLRVAYKLSEGRLFIQPGFDPEGDAPAYFFQGATLQTAVGDDTWKWHETFVRAPDNTDEGSFFLRIGTNEGLAQFDRLSLVPVGEDDNLVLNGGYERGIAGWFTPRGNLCSSEEQLAFEGQRALVCQPGQSAQANVFPQERGRYRLSLQVNPLIGNTNVRIGLYDPETAQFVSIESRMIQESFNGYEQVEIDFEVPILEGRQVRIDLLSFGVSYFDEVSITLLEAPPVIEEE